MNKSQKQVQQANLEAEEDAIELLKKIYEQAKKDTEKKISELSTRTDLENIQSIIYQKQYQEAIKKQLEGVLDDLQGKQFMTVADYLQISYDNGYVGVMYDLNNQGIPVIMPINQEQVVKALQTDSKISQGLYNRLGEDVKSLKKSIRSELTRGIAEGSTWNEIASRIANGMNSPYRKAFNNTIRIVRTEGHRIQQQAALDAQHRAKEAGAYVVKQWDSTLDNRTRPHHRRLDGQIRELDESFKVDGLKATAPGQFGRAAEDCNCRCCLLQRASWALDEDELEEQKERAKIFGLDKTEDFEDFKKKYLEALKKQGEGLDKSTKISTIKEKLTDTDRKAIYDYMSAKSYTLNEKLRTGATLSIQEKEFVTSLDTALEKLPFYEGDLQRSLYFYSEDDIADFVKAYAKGNKITYDEYISTTKGKEYNPEGQVQLYIRGAKKGKNISELNKDEDEVLYKRNASFVIINIIKKNGKYYILMEEDKDNE